MIDLSIRADRGHGAEDLRTTRTQTRRLRSAGCLKKGRPRASRRDRSEAGPETDPYPAGRCFTRRQILTSNTSTATYHAAFSRMIGITSIGMTLKKNPLSMRGCYHPRKPGRKSTLPDLVCKMVRRFGPRRRPSGTACRSTFGFKQHRPRVIGADVVGFDRRVWASAVWAADL
jgi:hypothetical protein